MSLLLWAVVASGCYTVRAAYFHNDLYNTRRPVSDVLADSSTPARERQQLQLVQDVMHFAATEGLNTAGAYKYYIQTTEPVVSYLVQAAQPDRLEFVTWWFPVVGSVPYLGFFARADRDAKAQALTAAGFDVNVGGVGAFSSLGWFDDPIFSSMLARGEADLAHLFFHELTHRTLWIAGSPEFNENLAEYVASVVTVRFLSARGKTPILDSYRGKAGDKALFRGWLEALKAELTALYAKRSTQPKAQILAEKAAIFQRYQQPPLKPAFKVADYVQGEEWNNASVLGASLYEPEDERFAKAFACQKNGNIRDFLTALREKAAQTAGPFLALERMCGLSP